MSKKRNAIPKEEASEVVIIEVEVKAVETEVKEAVKEEHNEHELQHDGFAVEIGRFDTELMAGLIQGDLLYKGYESTVKAHQGKYVVWCGVFSQKQNALNRIFKLESFGYRPYLV